MTNTVSNAKYETRVDINRNFEEKNDADDRESKETFMRRIFGPDLNLLEPGVSIKTKVLRVIESNYFHITVIVLVLLDTCVVATELITALQQSQDCKEKGKESTLELALKYTGLSILGLFIIEIIVKLVFNTHHFIRSKLEILDAVVVIVSFILDIVFFSNDASIALELLIVLRLWRIARIVNGTIMAIKNREKIKREKLNEKVTELKNEIILLKSELLKKEAIINELQEGK